VSEAAVASFYEAVNYDGLVWLIAAVFVAGIVRGFSGFGTAMVYLPVAAQFVSPIWAITTMVIFDMFGPLPLVPRAVRDGNVRDSFRLAAGMIVAVPIGITALSLMPAEVFRYVASGAIMFLLVLLVGGVRYRGKLTKPLIYFTGGLGGLFGGSVGMAGPPVIMLYMASDQPTKVIRANILIYLLLTDFIMLAVFHGYGFLNWTPVFIGLLLLVPYAIAGIIGSWIFDPEKEKLFRWVAYSIIGCSAVYGLPFWN
jgi:uncharacterized membrane protein YfcA